MGIRLRRLLAVLSVVAPAVVTAAPCSVDVDIGGAMRSFAPPDGANISAAAAAFAAKHSLVEGSSCKDRECVAARLACACVSAGVAAGALVDELRSENCRYRDALGRWHIADPADRPTVDGTKGVAEYWSAVELADGSCEATATSDGVLFRKVTAHGPRDTWNAVAVVRRLAAPTAQETLYDALVAACGAPHLTWPEAELFERRVANSTYFEYGAGGTTALASAIARSVTTVDLSAKWLETVASRAPDARRFHVDLGPLADWSYLTTTDRQEHWPAYAASLDRVAAADTNVVLVDGRFRVACALTALIRFPKATVLVHDWDRTGYHVLLAHATILEATDVLVVLARRPDFDASAAGELLRRYAYYEE